jgi:peptide/nickel transport system permease protein
VVARGIGASGSWTGRLRERLLGNDLIWDFLHSPAAVTATAVFVLLAAAAALAPWVAPHDPFDPATLDLANAFRPPAFSAEGDREFPLGTDEGGGDILSLILLGSRISLLVGLASVAAAVLAGVTLGLVAGYAGGFVDSLLMRVADVQLTFPAILTALLVDGVARSVVRGPRQGDVALLVLVLSIGLSSWVQYARTVRGSVMVERRKEYVDAARVIGRSPAAILVRHILPNVTGPVLVIATVNLALAIITEATLSFLGVGMPPTTPSLGTLIGEGQKYLFSGEWWIAIFPSLALVALALSVNVLGDWLRDALNPRLR